MGVELGSIISWVFCGLLVGLLARFAGGEGMGLLVPLGLSVLGAVMSGYILSWLWGAPESPFSLSATTCIGWLVACLGGALVLWIYVALNRNSGRE